MLKVFPSKWCVGFSSYFAFFSSLSCFSFCARFSSFYSGVFLYSHIHNLIAQDIVLEFKQRFSTFFLSSIFFSIFMKLFHFPYFHSLFFYLSVSHFENIFLLLCVLLLISYDFLMFRIFLSICFVSLAYAQAF